PTVAFRAVTSTAAGRDRWRARSRIYRYVCAGPWEGHRDDSAYRLHRRRRAEGQAVTGMMPDSAPGHGISLGEATRVWTRIALLSFGGPAGQIAVMHRILVEELRWISEARFL